jgi:hypothetical protein
MAGRICKDENAEEMPQRSGNGEVIECIRAYITRYQGSALIGPEKHLLRIGNDEERPEGQPKLSVKPNGIAVKVRQQFPEFQEGNLIKIQKFLYNWCANNGYSNRRVTHTPTNPGAEERVQNL